MELKPQLANQLRGPRMSGVMETLSARERQAIDGQWSYLDFLSRLLEACPELVEGMKPNAAPKNSSPSACAAVP